MPMKHTRVPQGIHEGVEVVRLGVWNQTDQKSSAQFKIKQSRKSLRKVKTVFAIPTLSEWQCLRYEEQERFLNQSNSNRFSLQITV